MEGKPSVLKIVCAVGGAIILGGLVWLTLSSTREVQAPTTTASLLTVAPDDYSEGTTTASVTLVEYLDFECEACGAYFPLVKQLEKEFPNDLRVVRRYFPLPGHRNGLTAALAVEAAARQSKYTEMHDLLFTEQEKWGEKNTSTPAVFEDYAKQLGLDMEKFKQDVASPEVAARVQRDIDSGKKLGNSGTPTFFLNGEKIQNPQGYEPFKALIKAKVSTSAPVNQ